MKLLFAFLFTAFSINAHASEHALRFPEILPQFAAEDLNERPITLPDNSSATLTLYVFAYQREQQSEVDSALEAIAPLFEAYGSQQFDYIEIPTIEDYGSLFRWYVDGAMRSGIVEEEKRARVVTYYTDMEAFRSRYGVHNLETITSVLADRDGNVYWSQSGPVEAKDAAILQRLVTDLLQKKSGKNTAWAL